MLLEQVSQMLASFTFKPSNNVGSSYYVGTNNQNYVANTKHSGRQ